MPREDAIVASVLRYLNRLEGGVAEKVQGTAYSSGKADINACYKGQSIRIEMKTPDNGNKTTKKQEVNLLRWRTAGALAFSAYSLKEVIDQLEPLIQEKAEKCTK